MSIAKQQFPHRGWATVAGRRSGGATRRVLLAAGPLSSLLYVVFTDGIAASRWEGYRRSEQMVSPLKLGDDTSIPRHIVATKRPAAHRSADPCGLKATFVQQPRAAVVIRPTRHRNIPGRSIVRE